MAPDNADQLPPPPSDDDVTVDPLIQDGAAAATVQDEGEGGRMKMIVQLIKRSLGVKDIAAMRISLPASLLEPVPNLEYWMYLDRPDLFAAINDSTDPLERMLAVLRFTFSKDLKFVHGKVVKPYNSVLGEHFRAHWTVKPVTYPSDPTEPPIVHHHRLDPSTGAPPSETPSIKSSTSTKKGKGGSIKGGEDAINKSLNLNLAADMSSLSLAGKSVASSSTGVGEDGVRVVFLTEQVSHHPPISSYYCGVPDRGIEAVGVDQISAKVSGASVRVQPGAANQGIFVSLTSGPGVGEKYQITHPVAIVNGVLRGAPYATISESTIITCTHPDSKQHLRAIIEYKDESWIGRAQYALEGVIHEYDPATEDHVAWTRVKHVPVAKVIVTFEGSWKKKVQWKRASETTKHTLIDLSTLGIIPKTVRPISEQHHFESRKLWEHVTSNLLSKNYGEATKHKQTIEQAQRDRAADRKKRDIEFVPVYFHPDISTGIPALTEEGRKAVEAEAKAQP